MSKADLAQGAAKSVRGRVVYVNEAHGWYRVEGETPCGVIRECFHFSA